MAGVTDVLQQSGNNLRHQLFVWQCTCQLKHTHNNSCHAFFYTDWSTLTTTAVMVFFTPTEAHTQAQQKLLHFFFTHKKYEKLQQYPHFSLISSMSSNVIPGIIWNEFIFHYLTSVSSMFTCTHILIHTSACMQTQVPPSLSLPLSHAFTHTHTRTRTRTRTHTQS